MELCCCLIRVSIRVGNTVRISGYEDFFSLARKQHILLYVWTVARTATNPLYAPEMHSTYFQHLSIHMLRLPAPPISHRRYKTQSLPLYSFGLIMSSGRTCLSKSSSLMTPSSMALSFSVMPFLCAFLAVLEALS